MTFITEGRYINAKVSLANLVLTIDALTLWIDMFILFIPSLLTLSLRP